MKTSIKVGEISVQLTNSSLIPTELLKAIAKLVVGQMKPPVRRYTIQVKNRRGGFSGSGWIGAQVIRFHRHYRRGEPLPWKFKDSRYSWSHEYLFNDRVECLVYIMAHECAHAIFHSKRIVGQKLKRADEEYRCDDRAYEVVKLWRLQKAEIWIGVKAAMRRILAQKKTSEQRKKSMARGTPAYYEKKLALAQENLTRWERKKRAADRIASKWKKRIRYYEKASMEELRMAALKGPPV